MDENSVLKKHTHIQNYYILSPKLFNDEIIVYHVEHMKQNRELYLYEYFPQDIAKRYSKNDNEYRVYTHPSNSELFESNKTTLQEAYNKLKLINHPSLPVIYETLELNGTLYTSTQAKDKLLSLKEQLHKDKHLFSEQFIGKLALNIVKALTLLQRHELQVYNLSLENILYDNTTQIPLLAYTAYKKFDNRAIQNSIRELGEMLESLVDANVIIQNYSASLQGLIKRMLSDEPKNQLQTFEELQTLLQSYDITALQKHTLDEKKGTALASIVSFVAIVLSISFIYYLFSRDNITTEKINWFDSLQYHALAYVGNAEAQGTLGLMYEKGYYVDADINEAIYWYEKISPNNENAQLSLAHIYQNVETVKDDAKAFKMLLQLAQKNNLYAQRKVGYSYLIGKGIAKDYKQARYWINRAYAQGDAYAAGLIGWMYETGKGANKNLSKALNYYVQGAQKNDTYSKKAIERVEKKIEKEAKTAEYNRSLKEYATALKYEFGKGETKNHTLALRYYKKAEKNNHPNAAFKIAQLYERSNEIPRDYKAALHWYTKSAKEDGNKLAYYRVSKLYRAGNGVAKNDVIALKWCKEAAKRGLGVAQGIMGSSYEYGWGTKKDYEKARYWYELAIESGYPNAHGRLEKLDAKIAQEQRRQTPQQKQTTYTTNKKIRTKVTTPKRVTYSSNANQSNVVNIRSCLACHGQRFEKRALGKSAIVSRMSKSQIITALKGYKRGTYGGAMKGIMKGQVMRYSDRALEKVAQTIAGN